MNEEKMETVNSGNQENLPFKEPEDSAPIEQKTEDNDQAQSPPEPIIAVAPKAGELHVVTPQGQDSEKITHPAFQLLNHLQQATETLRGLNLEGFRQIYPIFLSIFGAFLLGLALLITLNLLESINQLPLFGGALQGAAELVGFVALVRFVTLHLLKQQKRADLLTRIAHLKKKLLG